MRVVVCINILSVTEAIYATVKTLSIPITNLRHSMTVFTWKMQNLDLGIWFKERHRLEGGGEMK